MELVGGTRHRTGSQMLGMFRPLTAVEEDGIRSDGKDNVILDEKEINHQLPVQLGLTSHPVSGAHE